MSIRILPTKNKNNKPYIIMPKDAYKVSHKINSLDVIFADPIKNIIIPLKDDNNIPNGNILRLKENSFNHNTIKKALEKGYTIQTPNGNIFPD